MSDLREKIIKAGEKFGITLTPDNMDQVIRETWEKYYKTVKKDKR
ncbi:MAG: hypothetical protein PHQ23_10165 [Candidatus Wallbacteria bacterium]|nr:hypothetical protein [Candidatus Wallbacteria bacterium]